MPIFKHDRECLRCEYNILCSVAPYDIRKVYTCESCHNLMVYLLGSRVAVVETCPRLVCDLEHRDGAHRHDKSLHHGFDMWITFVVRYRSSVRDGNPVVTREEALERASSTFCFECAPIVADKLLSELEEIRSAKHK